MLAAYCSLHTIQMLRLEMSKFYRFKMTNCKLTALLKHCLPFILAGFINVPIIAQPQPGNVFREYICIPEMAEGKAGKFLRDCG